MIEYTWNFPKATVIKSKNGLSNVISELEWVLTGTDGEYSKSASGSLFLMEDPDPEMFIDFEDIDKDWLIELVMKQVPPRFNYEALISWIEEEIENQKNPPTEVKTFYF